MNYLAKFIIFFPLILIILELILVLNNSNQPKLTPQSDNNQYLSKLTQALKISQLDYQQIELYDHRQEVEFIIVSNPLHSFKVVLSTNQSPFPKVSALQKLIKIANIEGREINFVDLSSKRPYATF
jgi:hypothetical protein